MWFELIRAALLEVHDQRFWDQVPAVNIFSASTFDGDGNQNVSIILEHPPENKADLSIPTTSATGRMSLDDIASIRSICAARRMVCRVFI